MKLKKRIPVIDQGNKLGFWGGKFGGNFVPETLKKPIEDLEILFNNLKEDKKFIAERDKYFKNWIGTPTRFIKLENLTKHVGGAQIWSKVVSDANGGAHKIYNATVHCLLAKQSGKKFIIHEIPYEWPKDILKNDARLNIGFDPKLFTTETLKIYFNNSCNLFPVVSNLFKTKAQKRGFRYYLAGLLGESKCQNIAQITNYRQYYRLFI